MLTSEFKISNCVRKTAQNRIDNLRQFFVYSAWQGHSLTHFLTTVHEWQNMNVTSTRKKSLALFCCFEILTVSLQNHFF